MQIIVLCPEQSVYFTSEKWFELSDMCGFKKKHSKYNKEDLVLPQSFCVNIISR